MGNKPPSSSDWGLSIPVLLIGIPSLFVTYWAAGYNAYSQPLDLLDYYARIAPFVFVGLVCLSQYRKESLYLIFALLVAIAPLIYGWLTLVF